MNAVQGRLLRQRGVNTLATRTQKANDVTVVYDRCYNNSSFVPVILVKSYTSLCSGINLRVHLSISQMLQRM